MKKIFIVAAILFLIQGVAFAKKSKPVEIPLEDRVKVAVEVTDRTSFHELDTAKILQGMISEQLIDKKIFNVVGYDSDENFSELKSLGEKKSASDVGELLYFNPAEISYGAGTDGDLEQEKFSGVDYVVKCQILALGVTSKTGDALGIDPGFGIGIGSHRHFGIGIFSPIGISVRKNYYCAAVNLQFIKVDTNVVLWQKNLVGQARRHKKPSKHYDDASDEAYLKSLKDATEIIVERVENYSTKFLLKVEEKKS